MISQTAENKYLITLTEINLDNAMQLLSQGENILNDFNLNIDLNWQIEALSNIVKNAIEHSNENDIVYINCNDNKIYSKIEIINNGIINDKDLNKIDIVLFFFASFVISKSYAI